MTNKKDIDLINEAYDRDRLMRKAALRRAGVGRGDGEVTQERGNPYEDKKNLPAGRGKKLDERDVKLPLPTVPSAGSGEPWASPDPKSGLGIHNKKMRNIHKWDKRSGKYHKPRTVSTEDDGLGDGYKEKGQRREALSMLSNVEKFLASDGDADSVAVVHDAIRTMYMRVAAHVEHEVPQRDDRDDDYRGEDPGRRETDQDRYGYPGDR
jgi:hypothetical protein